MHDPSVLEAIIAAIEPSSERHGHEAATLARRAGRADTLMEILAQRLGAAQHTARPIIDHKHVLVCAGDHGLALARMSRHSRSPAAVAVEHVAGGKAAVNAAARAASAALTIVDCGVRGGASGPGVVDVRLGDGTADIRRGPAMSAESARMSVHTGIALMLSLADTGAQCVALGQLAPGSQAVSQALVAVLAPGLRHHDGDDHGGDDDDAVARALAANDLEVDQPIAPLTTLAALGGFEIGVMAGVILAAASLRVPVVIDDHGTSVAALLAARLAPDVPGYLLAAHTGQRAAHKRALAVLGLTPIFDLGLAHGEGTGACLVLPILDSATRMLMQT